VRNSIEWELSTKIISKANVAPKKKRVPKHSYLLLGQETNFQIENVTNLIIIFLLSAGTVLRYPTINWAIIRFFDLLEFVIIDL
jgi:hypothetical protein